MCIVSDIRCFSLSLFIAIWRHVPLTLIDSLFKISELQTKVEENCQARNDVYKKITQVYGIIINYKGIQSIDQV